MKNNYAEFVEELKNIFQNKKETNEIIFVCIGTDRVIGDSLGPFIGSLLKSKLGHYTVIGDLEKNITFENIEEELEILDYKNKENYIIAIDAALSDENNIGNFYIDKNGISIGKGLNKNKEKIGDIGIKVVVGKNYKDNELNFKCLQNKKISDIIELANATYKGIELAMK